MEITEIKQQYLRSEIIDKGYDPEKFSEFLSSQSEKGLDIESWTIEELGEAVYKFQNLNENPTEQPINNNNNNNNPPSKSSPLPTTTLNQPSTSSKSEDFIPCQKQERNTFTNMSDITIIISE
jgi:hypothetical protein